MHRKKLLDLLENHNPSDNNELKMTNETIEFVKTNEDCFKRELLIGHVTGSAWIVNDARTHVLMMHHRKLNQWFQPGGHCDGDPDVLNVALKEANEETGLKNLKVVDGKVFDVDVHLIPERKGIPAHYHYDVRFLIESDMNEPLIVTEESNDLAWVSLDKIAEHNDSESIMRMARKI
ncbi:NUDIX hydrolase [Emticicia aquatilis]|uniref:NUDIX hydrolase n=1 Tax=Emticicia aquatilis TaxID=1537369 RepID=A0A916YRU3_9BACT|nr:NUDIX hydrolase [Emticicia aquatilis]GGD57578.1 NUDIX hydrolase [Emticicia aquatilis]